MTFAEGLAKLNEALTPEERNKIMGHRKGDSSTYLQYYMSNFIDGYRSRELAEGTEMQKRYDRYSKKINNLRRVLKASRLQKAIQDFHTNVHVDEVNRQKPLSWDREKRPQTSGHEASSLYRAQGTYENGGKANIPELESPGNQFLQTQNTSQTMRPDMGLIYHRVY
ncbi:uncharacterized protein HRG_12019 [Hirsutella rhossiliensis]|uniref:Uncharacterized protein n=1 Tax=Hirsutella rhossiliensis TaxID=111463 RepID=A0A9P8MPK4_9HYPO|nr:uncharacterized protein HRG_12019 [Hirsutella rhossiliensis]KAH0956907.1 hypothetical protein HRG_12019 [Hirsutella rhossiliensis]